MNTPCIDHGRKGDTCGYASCRHEGKRTSRHVVALMERTGEKPNGRVARHRCDNPRCINGDHLEWGTKAQNSADMVERGRAAHGSRLPQAKLTEEFVSEIRDRLKLGEKGVYLARQFGVSPARISEIRTGKAWRHA